MLAGVPLPCPWRHPKHLLLSESEPIPPGVAQSKRIQTPTLNTIKGLANERYFITGKRRLQQVSCLPDGVHIKILARVNMPTGMRADRLFPLCAERCVVLGRLLPFGTQELR